MNGFNAQTALRYILSRLDQKAFGPIQPQIPTIIESFLLYDLHFMQLTGVLNENADRGEQEYDDDEAFEYIFDAYLSDAPCDDDTAMVVATLLNRYMELQYEYLKKHGLAED